MNKPIIIPVEGKTSGGNVNLPLVFLFSTIVFCSLAELALLGPQVFFGGHNKTAELSSVVERASFLFAFFTLNSIMYGLGYVVFRYVLKKFKICENYIAFHYMMIAGIITAVYLIIQFELHKYFAGAMDAALLKDIAGGELKTALTYVFDEAVLFLGGLILLLTTYFLIFRIVAGILKEKDRDITYISTSRGKSFVYLGFGMALVAWGVFAISKIDFLRANLSKFNGYTLVSIAFNKVSDIDGDGYGIFRYPQDIAALDAAIYPGALDIPGNGIDEDGFFGDFTNYTSTDDFPAGSRPVGEPKHIIIIMLESARAEVVDKILDGRFVAPNIHALSEDGLNIKDAYSHTGYTKSSLSSVFSGRIGGFNKDLSIFPILKNNGYQVAIFSGQDESWGGIDEQLSTRENTHHFYDAQAGAEKRVFPSRLPVSIKLSEKTLWDEFEIYAENLDWNKPQFIYFNMQAAHFPYYHEYMPATFVSQGIPRSEINSGNKEWLQRTYWNSLSHADVYIGKIIKLLKESGKWDETLLIISGDHGEELFDNDHLGHGFLLSDVQTHIPLVISKRDFKVSEPVGLSDMKGLVLSYAFNYDEQMNEKVESGRKSVFQLIGSLESSKIIALRYPGKKQITFDLRNMLVRPVDSSEWISYEQAISDPDVKDELQHLVFYWENLRWQSFLESEIENQ